MTRRDLRTTLLHLAEEFDRLRLAVAERLTTAEEGAFMGLVFALEETIDHLPMLDEDAEEGEA